MTGPEHRIHGQSIVIASHNAHKITEFNRLLMPLQLQLVSAAALGLPEPEETGATFHANAEIKARAIAEASGKIALSDDSGLAVDALGGDPGIYSARWAGPARDFDLAMSRVEEKLQGQDNRRAYFITVLALCWPDGAVEYYEGRVQGHLIWPPRGVLGFGYDPMFVPDGHTMSFGEMTPADKARLSHRASACAALVERHQKVAS